MIDNIKHSVLNGNVNFHTMHSAKFKTDFISFSYATELTEESATYNTLLSRVLERGSRHYPNINAFSRKLDFMYGAFLGVDAAKMGEKHVVEVKMGYASSRFVGESLEDEAIGLIREIMYDPLVSDGRFRDDIFDGEVKNLRDDIEARENEKMQFSIERCIEIACEGEPFENHSLGSIRVLDAITSASLYDHYTKLISESVVDIIAIGNFDNGKLEKAIIRAFGSDLRGSSRPLREEIVTSEASEKRIVDKYDVQQAKIALAYKTGVSFKDSDYEALMLMSNILGGGANSLLFENVREKHSLCYYVFSTIDKFKGLVIIGAGVQSENIEETLRLIDENIEMMKNGEFTDENLSSAKLKLISAVDSVSDSASSYANFYYNYALFRMEFSPEDYKKRIVSVTRDDIVRSAKLMKKDTVYILDGKGEN
jgi:predicted Zn-dependent peptidase